MLLLDGVLLLLEELLLEVLLLDGVLLLLDELELNDETELGVESDDELVL